jgi:hypothetical protein
MTPFAIAGIQMPIIQGNNIDAMKERLDLTLHMYPWVQMVLFSELAPFGSGRHFAEPMPGPIQTDIIGHAELTPFKGGWCSRRTSLALP